MCYLIDPPLHMNLVHINASTYTVSIGSNMNSFIWLTKFKLEIWCSLITLICNASSANTNHLLNLYFNPVPFYKQLSTIYIHMYKLHFNRASWAYICANLITSKQERPWILAYQSQWRLPCLLSQKRLASFIDPDTQIKFDLNRQCILSNMPTTIFKFNSKRSHV